MVYNSKHINMKVRKTVIATFAHFLPSCPRIPDPRSSETDDKRAWIRYVTRVYVNLVLTMNINVQNKSLRPGNLSLSY
jgi:hypothetical protein